MIFKFKSYFYSAKYIYFYPLNSNLTNKADKSALNSLSTTVAQKADKSSVPFSFGIDASGNYGYYKGGVFYPFKHWHINPATNAPDKSLADSYISGAYGGCFTNPVYHTHTSACYTKCLGTCRRENWVENGWAAKYYCKKCGATYIWYTKEQFAGELEKAEACSALILTCGQDGLCIGYSCSCGKNAGGY